LLSSSCWLYTLPSTAIACETTIIERQKTPQI
ncbi:MAG: hypothetical protein ACI8QY_000338, partial [bacterium]